MPRLDLNDLKALAFNELIQTARGLGVGNPSAMPRQQLLFEILRARSQSGVTVGGSGILEILPDGFGFLRDPGSNFLSGPDDIYVSPSQIRRFKLRTGDQVSGVIRAPKGGEKYFALIKVESVNDGVDPEAEEAPARLFTNLTPVYPNQRLRLEHDPADLSTRLLDLVAPMGRGQRGLIIAPPRTGRCELLRSIARALESDSADLHLIVLLIDERPEEITAFNEAVSSGEVIASSCEEQASRHTQIAEMVHDRACRLVEKGRDVVVLVSNLTRLARAYHHTTAEGTRAMPSGMDAAAMITPRRLFGAARKVEEGGSLTILAAATTGGSRLDADILDELRGAANQEILLSSAVAGARIIPALDPSGCFTLRSERLLDADEAADADALRDALSGDPVNDMLRLSALAGSHPTNRALVDRFVALDNQRPTGK